MKNDFDTIIVGSGFGGSVVAARLAESLGERVCVLERGKAYGPGDFPRSPREMSEAFWNPSANLHGMYNVWSFEKFSTLVSSGLGGGSLIYANVMLRKEASTFDDAWPVTRAELDPHYERVERALGVTPFPYPATPKAVALGVAARALSHEAIPAPLAISFGAREGDPIPADPHNIHGRARSTCRMCGECNIGCNYGSKNTLDHTYLSAARRAGARIQTRSEVKALRARSNGEYDVDVREYADDGSASTKTLRCRRLVLAAGALGTPYLLLKDRASLGRPSDRLGERFSTNGDLLTVVARSRDGGRVRRLDPTHGPVITSYVRFHDENTREHYVEDAGVPHVVAWIVHMLDVASALDRTAWFARRWIRRLFGANPDRDLSAEVAALFGDCALSTSSLPLLGMGRDEPNGRMSLVEDDGKVFLQIDWSADRSNGYFDEVRRSMSLMARALGGELVDAPTWSRGRVVTVHPLGGCPMGRDRESGFVDAYGKAFDCGNLWVADGSVMPGPVGPNPALTIAALADRSAERMLADDAK